MELGRSVGVFRCRLGLYAAVMAYQTVKMAAGVGLFTAVLRSLLGLPAVEAAWSLARWMLILGAALSGAGWLYGLLLDRGVQVFERGIRSADFWGRYHELPWSVVQSARPASVGGLRYVAVSSTSPKVELWIPTFLANPTDFCAALRSSAGPAHPLTREFLRAAA
jgi:hypothetical protein